MDDSTSVERWLPIPGYDLYEVSDQGRVWSAHVDRLLKLRPDKDGYLRVNLRRAGVGRDRPVHRLVLEAFVGPCPDGQECCHGSGGLADNRLANLRWGTKSENAIDRVRAGNDPRGRRLRCPRGHELCEANTSAYVRGRGHRTCLACVRAYQDAYRARKRGEQVPDSYATADAHYARLMA